MEKRVVKSPKLYLIDNGFLSLFSGIIDKRILESLDMRGSFFENLLIGNIKKYVENERLPVNAYFYRTYQGAEVDLVLECEPGLLLFEIKSGNRFKESMLTGFNSMKEEVGRRIHSCYVIYNGPFKKVRKDVFCVPGYFLI